LGFAVLITWLIKPWALTGNPVYPLFYGIFGGIEFSADGWARYQRCHLLFNTPPGMAPNLSTITMAHYALMATGIILAMIVIWATRRSALAVPLRFAALFTAGVCTGSYFSLRFILGALPPVAAYVAWRLRGRERIVIPALCVAAR